MDQPKPTIKETLDTAANRIKTGDISAGKQDLEWVLEREPDNVLAWLWMSRCVKGREAKLECFQRVLAIEPNNVHALKGMSKLGGSPVKSSIPQGSGTKRKLIVPAVLVFAVVSVGILIAIFRPFGLNEDGCDNVWFSMFQYDVVLGLRPSMSEILNQDHPPNSVGSYMKSCIRRGWQPMSFFEEQALFTCNGNYTVQEAIMRSNFPIDITGGFLDAPVDNVLHIQGINC